MNRATLEKLQQNPHYKISGKQRTQVEDEDREDMVEFGQVKMHGQAVPVHQVQHSPLKRRSRKMLE